MSSLHRRREIQRLLEERFSFPSKGSRQSNKVTEICQGCRNTKKKKERKVSKKWETSFFQASGHTNEHGTGAGRSPSVYEPLQNHQLVMTTQAIISAARTGLLLLKPGKRCLIIRHTSTGAACVCVFVRLRCTPCRFTAGVSTSD